MPRIRNRTIWIRHVHQLSLAARSRVLPIACLFAAIAPSGCAVSEFPQGIRETPAPRADTEAYLLPFPPGAPRLVGQSNFGVAGLGSHRDEYAIDFVMKEDSPVLAARGGIVVGVRDACPNINCPLDPTACCGNVIRVQHADGTVAAYYHLRQWGSCVAVGDRVERGDVIGRSGNTGYSMMAHLHFAVFAEPGGVGTGDFGPSRNNSMQIGFADVEGNGVPQFGRWYFSANEQMADRCQADAAVPERRE